VIVQMRSGATATSGISGGWPWISPTPRAGLPRPAHRLWQAPGKTLRQELGMPEAGNTLTLETTQGLVVIDMRPDLAPAHVAHIKKLVGEKFYDGIVFHRVIEGFMAQTGCPHGTGTGGSKYPNLKAEFNAEPHVRGTCSMARAQDVNSANSQFFICFGDARFLDKQYTVWGKVTAGMENVDKIKRGEPVRDPDRIVSATVG
jgi:peptidylprolyl isomerase